MMNYLKNIRFSVALIILGGIFFLLGLIEGFNFNNYSLTIQDAWARIAISFTGIVLIIVSIILELKTYSSRDFANDKSTSPNRRNNDNAATEMNRSLNAGAILYFLAETTGYHHRREFMQSVRLHATELFAATNLANSTNGSYHYWYKQGRESFSIFIEPDKNEAMRKVMTYTFLFALALLRRLQMENEGKNTGISITLHPGDDINISRYGDLIDYWGQSLDVARHLTESSNHSQFIISHEALTHLRGLFNEVNQGFCKNLLEQVRGLTTAKLEYETRWLEPLNYNLLHWTLTNQHFQNQTIHGFTISDSSEIVIGNPIRPPDWLQMEHRDNLQPHNPAQRFVKYLTEAEEICIVGMTHENTAEYLDTALKARKGSFWKNIQVVFPSEQTLKEVKELNRSFEERKKKWEDSKRQLIIFFESQGNQYLDNWACIECDENFSFWGNRLMIRDRRLIRVAPLIQGADLKNMPYMTFSEGMDGFSLLSEAFDVILASGNSIVEWDLFGKLTSDEFIYQGLANHARLDAFADYCQPVTIVILHTREIDQRKILLQKRSIFNAVDGYDKYSNISGRLCISDVTNPETVREFYHQVSKIEKKSKYKDLTPHQESNLATDIFSDITKFVPGALVTLDAWENAAIREIREELGLTVDKSKLRFQASYNLNHPNLCFRIYSLEIGTFELQEIKERRSYAGLEPFGRSQLIEFHKRDQFNRLLQNRFDEVFLPIFNNLEIST